MVVTVGAINKKGVNNLYEDSEKTEDEKPIDLINTSIASSGRWMSCCRH
jgi:type III restriction enzyme